MQAKHGCQDPSLFSHPLYLTRPVSLSDPELTNMASLTSQLALCISFLYFLRLDLHHAHLALTVSQGSKFQSSCVHSELLSIRPSPHPKTFDLSPQWKQLCVSQAWGASYDSDLTVCLQVTSTLQCLLLTCPLSQGIFNQFKSWLSLPMLSLTQQTSVFFFSYNLPSSFPLKTHIQQALRSASSQRVRRWLP